MMLVAIGCLASSCKKEQTPGDNEVFIQGNKFDPATITVAAGTVVVWTNKDNVAHTVTSTGHFDSGSISAGMSFSINFDSTGTFDYHCTLHSGMTGTVVVQ